jgi:polar amino acid transport system substrate-binding protein
MLRTLVLLYCLVAPLSTSAFAQGLQGDPRVDDIIRSGKLRIGVFPSFQYSKDQPQSLALNIAKTVAKRLGIGDVVPLEFPTPPQVIACVKAGDCDVGFMLIDPARAVEVDFTPAFVRSDFTYLVPPGSALHTAADVDQPGIRIAAVRGHASTIALTRLVKQAQPVYADTFDPTFELLRSGNADAFASIRQILIQYSSQLPGSHVLDDSYLTNSAGIAIPKGNAGRLSYFSEALDELKGSGSLKRMVEEAALRGVEVVPSGASR